MSVFLCLPFDSANRYSVAAKCEPFAPSVVRGVKSSSGLRSAEGSSCSSLHDRISFRANNAVGLSAAFVTESTVLGRLVARRKEGLPPLLLGFLSPRLPAFLSSPPTSLCSLITRSFPSPAVDIKYGPNRAPVTAELRQLTLWGKSKLSLASPFLIYASSACTISSLPKGCKLSLRYASIKAYRKKVVLAMAICPRSSTPWRGTIISASRNISSLYSSPTQWNRIRTSAV